MVHNGSGRSSGKWWRWVNLVCRYKYEYCTAWPYQPRYMEYYSVYRICTCTEQRGAYWTCGNWIDRVTDHLNPPRYLRHETRNIYRQHIYIATDKSTLVSRPCRGLLYRCIMSTRIVTRYGLYLSLYPYFLSYSCCSLGRLLYRYMLELWRPPPITLIRWHVGCGLLRFPRTSGGPAEKILTRGLE